MSGQGPRGDWWQDAKGKWHPGPRPASAQASGAGPRGFLLGDPRRPRSLAFALVVKHVRRLSRTSKLALIALWGVIALFVLSDLSEDVRGDPSLMPILPWNFVGGAILSALILVIEVLVRFARRFAHASS